jgi:anaphase-promoting complex subunit 3
MKRPRGGHGLKLSDTPVGGLAIESRLNRDLRSMEINGGDKVLDPPVRRSSRLNTSTKTTTSRVTMREKRSTRSQSVASSASGQEANHATLEAQTSAAVDDWLRDIVRRCGRAYRALSMYQCREALAEIDALPRELQSSPWVLRLMAKSFYFMSEHKKGARVFKRLVEIEPYNLALMDLYSTSLWHMEEATELSDLAQRLMSVDRESPETWIAAGNTLSVLKQHEEAARLFRRATQVDPGRANAWTLCGHEAWMTEETDRAIAFYRTAIRTDDREQAAWYGLGHVYLRLGKWQHAAHHFRRASEINPSSGPILCGLGEAMERGGNLVGALAEFDRAVALEQDVDRPLTRYRRARVLVGLGRLSVSRGVSRRAAISCRAAAAKSTNNANEQEAVAELEPVARASTDEPDVHFLLGKCYLKIHRKADAIEAFTTAREIDPKLEGAVRSVLLAGGVDMEDD